jgi:hypothetical protein
MNPDTTFYDLADALDALERAIRRRDLELARELQLRVRDLIARRRTELDGFELKLEALDHELRAPGAEGELRTDRPLTTSAGAVLIPRAFDLDEGDTVEMPVPPPRPLRSAVQAVAEPSARPPAQEPLEVDHSLSTSPIAVPSPADALPTDAPTVPPTPDTKKD